MPSHVFGPVPSRRLGRSLGVDLVPLKTCSYDCVYCQLGRTTCKTVQRKEWVPLDEVVAQVRDKLSADPDYITLSGSGEPTLYSRIGELIVSVKRITNIPVAVLTNGSLLWEREVQEGLTDADLLVPSLDAGDEALFQRVNRPHESISFERMLEGVVEFRSRFRGAYWLEVFLVGGISDTARDVAKIAGLVERIQPNRVQLNTVSRPPAENFAVSVSQSDMERFAVQLGEHAEVIADSRGVHREGEFTARQEDVLDLLRRRPCTVEDVASGLGMHVNEASKHVAELMERGAVVAEARESRLCYKAS